MVKGEWKWSVRNSTTNDPNAIGMENSRFTPNGTAPGRTLSVFLHQGGPGAAVRSEVSSVKFVAHRARNRAGKRRTTWTRSGLASWKSVMWSGSRVRGEICDRDRAWLEERYHPVREGGRNSTAFQVGGGDGEMEMECIWRRRVRKEIARLQARLENDQFKTGASLGLSRGVNLSSENGEQRTFSAGNEGNLGSVKELPELSGNVAPITLSDWLVTIGPSMKDLTPLSAIWWLKHWNTLKNTISVISVGDSQRHLREYNCNHPYFECSKNPSLWEQSRRESRSLGVVSLGCCWRLQMSWSRYW